MKQNFWFKNLAVLSYLLFTTQLTLGQGVVRTWQGTAGNTNIRFNTNWLPNLSDNNFSGSYLLMTGAGHNTMSVNSTQVIRQLRFSGATAYTIAISGTNTLGFANATGGINTGIFNNSTVNQTIAPGVSFSDNAKYGTISTHNLGSLTLSGAISLGSNLTELRLSGLNSLGTITLSGSITGSKPINIGFDTASIFQPNTSVILSGSNASLTGDIYVQSGILILRNANAIGSNLNGKLQVSNGAVLEINDGISVAARPIWIDGNGISNSGAIVSNSTSNTSITGNIILTDNARISNTGTGTFSIGAIGRNAGAAPSLIFDGTGNISVTGTIGQINGALGLNGLTKTGSGVLTLSQTCNYSGRTLVNNSGTLQLGGANILPSNSLLELNTATFRSGATTGNSQSFGGLQLSASGSGAITSTIALGTGSHQLTFANSNNLTWPTNLNHRLVITGWSGLAGSAGTAGRIFIQPDGINPGLTNAQLNQITFNGYCEGAILLGTGELVPSNLPFVRSVAGDPPGGTSSSFAGYVGSTMTLKGCRLNEVTSLDIGASLNIPFTLNGAQDELYFTLGDLVSGQVKLTSAVGGRTSNQSVTNLDFISISNNVNPSLWSESNAWLGGNVPPADRSVTIRKGIQVNAAINNPNTNPLNLVKSITLNSIGAIRLQAANLLPDDVPIRMNGGAFRTFDAATNDASATGYDETVGTLELVGNGVIALGNNVHTLHFAPSNLISWTNNRFLTIFNWQGVKGEPGTLAKIFVGNDASGLTTAQLNQINFNNYCFGAKLLANGELVPSDNPFIEAVAGNQGGLNAGYISEKVIINGCNLEDVTTVEVGSTVIDPANWDLVEIDPDPFITGDEFFRIEFTVTKNMPDGSIKLLTLNPLVFYEMSGSIQNLGYISQTDGDWSEASTWLGDENPDVNRDVTIAHTLTLDTDIGEAERPDSITILSGGVLNFADNVTLNANHLKINSGGNFMPSSGGIVNILDNGKITNNGTFSSSGLGEVNFAGTGTITGSSRIFFNDLTLNSGILYLPTKTGTSLVAPPGMPEIHGTFTIKGGRIYDGGAGAGDGNPRTHIGPLYADGSTLVYASGGSYARDIEWNSSILASNYPPWPGMPFNVWVRNGTTLTINTLPTAQPEPDNDNYLIMKGNLQIDESSVVNVRTTRGLEVMGNVSIGSGPSSPGTLILSLNADTLNRSLIVHGNFQKWINSTFTPNNKKVVFAGTQDATLSLPGEAANTSITLPFVQMRKLGGEVTLGNPLIVSTELLLTHGVLISSTANYLRLNNSTTMTGGNSTSFVQGPVQKITTATPSFEFQVGYKESDDNMYYRPVWIAGLLHNGTTTYTAEYSRAGTIAPPFEPLLLSLMGVWSNDWWQIDKSGNGQARVGIPYAPGYDWSVSGPPAGTRVGVARFNNTVGVNDWVFTKPSGDFDPGVPEFLDESQPGIIYSALLSSFSPFTIGWEYWQVLSLTLQHFSARVLANDVYLQWKIEDETDLKHFELEHSRDGTRFERIATIDSRNLKEYAFEHKNPGSGKHFYRLLMVERNGSKAYSRVELAQIGQNQTIISGLIQNPVQGSQALVRIYSALAQKADIQIYDASGRLVLSQKILLSAGDNRAAIPVFPLPGGYYQMGIRTQDGVSSFVAMMK